MVAALKLPKLDFEMVEWAICEVPSEGDPAHAWGIHSCACWAGQPDLGPLGNSERGKVTGVPAGWGSWKGLMAEEHKGYVQNRAIPMVLSFFRASHNPSLGLWWSRRYRMAHRKGFWGTWHGGARGWAKIPKLWRRLCPTWLPVALVFGQKLVCG